MAIATYLRYNGTKPLGGVINYFGTNPLSPENIDNIKAE